MGGAEKKELKDRGFIILEKLHLTILIFVMIVGFVVSMLVQKEILAKTVQDHEDRIKNLELVNKTNELQDKKKHDLLLELKYNLKTLMEKSGMKYQEITN